MQPHSSQLKRIRPKNQRRRKELEKTEDYLKNFKKEVDLKFIEMEQQQPKSAQYSTSYVCGSTAPGNLVSYIYSLYVPIALLLIC